MAEPYINKHISAAKDARIIHLNNQIKSYAIALKIALEEAEDMRKEIDNLMRIAAEEEKENKKLRGQIMKLERTIKAWTDHKKEAGM